MFANEVVDGYHAMNETTEPLQILHMGFVQPVEAPANPGAAVPAKEIYSSAIVRVNGKGERPE